MFLTPDELAELTDRRQHRAQIRWLEARGWKFEIGRSGAPKVLRAESERQMLSGPGRGRDKQLRLDKMVA